MCRPGLPLWIAAALCAPLLGACEPQTPAALDARAGAPAEPPSRARPAEDLLRVDLSDQAVAALSTEELWKLGVIHLGWPEELPAGATKDEVHQQLLQGKYRDVGDYGYGDDGRGAGYDR